MIRQYVGARYVPKLASPVEWAPSTSYEALTIVTFNNASYTSKVPVPPTVGNPANNPQYWALTGNYNAQVEQYRQETETVSNNLTTEITNRKNADTTLQGQITTVSNNLTTEITNRKNADTTLQGRITTEITNRETADATLQGNINSEAATRTSADSNLQSQINQIIAPSGEAPSAAEVQNARIGADGVTYDTLGEAIRGQVENLSDAVRVNEINSDYETKDSISDFATLKNGVSVRHYQPLALKFGFIKADGTVISLTDTLAYDTHYLPVNTGDFITSLGTTNGAIRCICAYDSQKNPIVSSGSDTLISSYRVPAGVSFVRVTLYTNSANDYRTMPALKIVSAGGFYAIGGIENVTVLKKNVQFDLAKDIDAVGFGWISATGAYYADSDEVLAYSDFILVNEGDVIKSNGVEHVSIRFIAAYDDTQTVISSAGSNDPVLSYTVPSGVRYIRVTMYVETAHDLTTFPSITVQKNGNYILPIVDETLRSSVYPAPANVVGHLSIDHGKTKSITKRGNLGALDKWTFEENNISTAKVLSFTAQISEFSAVQMGHGVSGTESNYIKIDASNVYEYGDGSVINTYPHGLSIENTIQVKIEVKAENIYNAYLTLTSNGNTFTQTMPMWYGDDGALFVESVGSVLTDCSFGWTCTNFTKPVYVFGDSYLGYASRSRWPYYLVKDGYNQLLDGFGGRNSAQALKSMKNDLIHGTPKHIFWCMGMNDPDNGAVNASWLSCVTELLDICTESGIIPILATIPNVTRSDRDNTYKNTWIRNSGYRYVDFASAVNANVKGASWYPGMLSSDGVHPDTLGAVTLYHQVLSDFPEIAII